MTERSLPFRPESRPQPSWRYWAMAGMLAVGVSLGAVAGEATSPRTLYSEAEPGEGVQSPIDIRTGHTRHAAHAIEFHYRPSPERVANRGHTIEAEFAPGSHVRHDGQRYELRQLHFHTPAEHRIDGVTYPLEMHLVHTSEDEPGRYLVVAVLFREGDDDALIARILADVPPSPGDQVTTDTLLDPLLAVGSDSGYFHYEGSLTTPPYTQSVTWLVQKDIHGASPGQISQLNRLEGDNARHIQALRSRVVEEQ